jgi:hypothetical protein
VAPDGDVMISGSFKERLMLGDYVVEQAPEEMGLPGFWARLSPEGEVRWVRRSFELHHFAIVRSIHISDTGSFYAAGSLEVHSDFDEGGYSGRTRGFVGRFEENGEPRWFQEIERGDVADMGVGHAGDIALVGRGVASFVASYTGNGAFVGESFFEYEEPHHPAQYRAVAASGDSIVSAGRFTLRQADCEHPCEWRGFVERFQIYPIEID